MHSFLFPLVFDRQSAIAWAQAVLREHNVVFLDTETTGLDAQSEVIEIAVVDSQGNVLIDSLVRPTGQIPLAAATIHGIFDHHVAQAPPWVDLFPALASACRNRVVVVYNAGYDSRLIHQSCLLAGVDPPASIFQCAMQAYAHFYAGYSGSRRPKNQRLETAARAFSLEIPNHRALGDALTCLGVVQGMATAT